MEIFAKDGGAALRYDLRRRNDRRWTFSLAGFERSFDYRVSGGGTWTLPFHIAVVDRPKLVSLQATLHYPKYFGPVEPRPNPPQAADVAGPEQSEVEIAVGVEGDVARGEIRLFQPSPANAATLVQTDAPPMHPSGKGKWSGRFPLLRDGFYRVHLENELKAANQTMKEGKLTAIVDRPPQITLERPVGDLTLSAPQKVPLVAAVYDDFCLDEVRIAVKKGDSEAASVKSLKKYAGIVRSDAAVLLFDLAPYNLKPGDRLRYHLEAPRPEGPDRLNGRADDHDRRRQQCGRPTTGPLREGAGPSAREAAQADRPAKQGQRSDAADRGEIRLRGREDSPGEGRGEAPAAATGAESKPPELDAETRKQLEQRRKELAGAATAESAARPRRGKSPASWPIWRSKPRRCK